MSYLRSGSVGEEVQALQRDLVTLGEPVEVTGTYDAATLAAIQRIQHAAFAGTTRPVDGEFSPATQDLVARKVKVTKAREAAQAPKDNAPTAQPEVPEVSAPEPPAAVSPEPPAEHKDEETHDESDDHHG